MPSPRQTRPPAARLSLSHLIGTSPFLPPQHSGVGHPTSWNTLGLALALTGQQLHRRHRDGCSGGEGEELWAPWQLTVGAAGEGGQAGAVRLPQCGVLMTEVGEAAELS